jgi:hypothetical protein
MHAYLLRPQHIVAPGASANRNSADATGYRVQLRNAVDVDQNARLRDPEIQHWQQALTAGQHGGVAFVTAQKSESSESDCGQAYSKRGGFIARSPPAMS